MHKCKSALSVDVRLYAAWMRLVSASVSRDTLSQSMCDIHNDTCDVGALCAHATVDALVVTYWLLYLAG